MKLIRRVKLTHKDGNVERIFEIDLCRTGSGKFAVNFRYGKTGARLKEGTKTKRSVPEAKARSIFARLVDDKKRKGYIEAGARPAANTGSRASGRSGHGGAGSRGGPVDKDARARAVIERLRTQNNSGWRLSRAAWRAGELGLKQAVPHLVALIGTGSSMRDYAIAWALGRLGDVSTLDLLLAKHGNGALDVDSIVTRVFPSSKKDSKVRRMAREMLRAWGGAVRDSVQRDALAKLPDSLRSVAESGSATDFERALWSHVEGGSARDAEALERAYEIDSERTRPGLLAAIHRAPMKPNTFKPLRHILKRAELRRDGEVFGLIAYRFEKGQAMFANRRYVYAGGRWTRASVELAKPNSSIAYSSATREYMLRHVWRLLERAGELGDAETYVRLAVGVLLPVKDGDGGRARSTRRYDYRSRSTVTTHWDSFASWRAFNHILYGNSHRYEYIRKTGTWRCTGGFTPGGKHPGGREELHPTLWDKMPVGLLHLLAESESGRVHNFAARALRANSQFCEGLDVDVLTMLLGRPYKITARLAYELALKRYDPMNPDFELVEAMAHCPVDEARSQAHRWIEEERHKFLAQPGLIAGLTMSAHKDTRDFARRLLTSSSLGTREAEIVIARVLAALQAFDIKVASGDAAARDACQTLQAAFARQLRSIGLNVVSDLLGHKLAAVQAFAAELLLGHDTRPRDLPEDLLAAVMNSKFESVRVVGIRLFGELPDRTLLERKALILALATSELADVRESIRPVIQRLVATHPDFASELARLLLTVLVGKERFEGLHSYLLRMLKSELLPSLRSVSKKVVLRLLKAQSSQAQELGGILLGRYVDWEELEIVEIARLASHEILSIREASWKFYRENTRRVKADMDAALRILDAKWDDSRAFAFDYFRGATFTVDDFTPSVIVSVCDSVREDVQAYGRELVGRFFNDDDGPAYLLKLSEHPSAELQLFASAYLEEYAAGDRERLRALQPFFLSVLSRVNRGRVAKARVFDFLVDEAKKNRESAELVAGILERQSVTMAIGDRAACIEAMLEIRGEYPEVPLPIRVRSPEAWTPAAVRGGA